MAGRPELVERYGEVVRSGLRYDSYLLSPRDGDRAAGLPVACKFAKLLPGLSGDLVPRDSTTNSGDCVLNGAFALRPGLRCRGLSS